MSYAEMAKVIKERMKILGMNQRELAQKSEVSESQISRILKLESTPGQDAIASIARGLKLPPASLFRAANLLPPVSENDAMQERIDYLFGLLKDPANKKRAIKQLELLQDEEASVANLNPKTQ